MYRNVRRFPACRSLARKDDDCLMTGTTVKLDRIDNRRMIAISLSW